MHKTRSDPAMGAGGRGLALRRTFGVDPLYTPLTEMRKTLLFHATVIWLLVGLLAPAFAQDGHARWHQYYREWTQPGTTYSCCNAREIGPGGEDLTGDCEPTQGRIRDGHWQAWLRQESRWLDIPDDKIIHERNPAGEEAHLCAVHTIIGTGWGWSVLCFVPPDTGG